MTTWIRRLLHLVRRRQFESDLAEEMTLHREMSARDEESAGLTPHDAALAASRVFGSHALAADQARDVWTWPWLRDAGQDVRFALRMIVKDRGFTVAAVVALALGIGANTTAFVVVENALVLRPLPFDSPDELVSVDEVDARGRTIQPAYPDFVAWRESSSTFAGMVGEIGTAMNLSGEDRAAERVIGSYVSAGTFGLLGRGPRLGRDFRPDDDRVGAAPVVIIGYGLWQSRYAGDPGVIGHVVRINDVPSTIVGVMPERFAFPILSEVWQPLSLFQGVADATRTARPRGATPTVFARMKPGVSLRQARGDLDAVAANLARDYPGTNKGITITLAPLKDRSTQGDARPLMGALMGAVLFVLLIGCVNVANLLLARSVLRARELAVRASLGASRWRLVRQLLIESAVLTVLAASVGLFLARVAVRIIATTFANPTGPDPYWIDWSLDWRVYAYVVFVSMLSTMLFGVVPALQVSRTNVNDVLKQGGPTSAGGRQARRWTSALMILELALTIVLLSGAGLILRSMLDVYRSARIVDPTDLITMRLAVAPQKYSTGEQRKRFFERLGEEVAALPGVSSATVASDIPFAALGTDAFIQRQVAIDGQLRLPDEKPLIVNHVYVGDRYFETLGVHVTQGRAFTAVDGLPGQEGAILNQRMASLLFGAETPIGRRLQLTVVNPNPTTAAAPWLSVVGVVPNVRQSIGSPEAEPVAYVPVRAEPALHRFASLIVRTVASPDSVMPSIREAVRRVDPDLPLYYVLSMDQLLSMSSPRPWLLIFGVLAGIALALASVGLSAVTAHSVAQRGREVGIRMALGAHGRQVVWLFVGRTVGQLLFGLPIGIVGALVARRLLPAFLNGVSGGDPLMLMAIATATTGVAIASSYLPARRAARIDPAMALRAE